MSDLSQNIGNSSISKIAKHPVFPVMLLCLASGVGVSLLTTSPHRNGVEWGLVLCAGGLLCLWGLLTACKRMPQWGHGVCWWGIGFFLRLRYILHFPYTSMQHDVGDFSMPDHHAGYILHFYHGNGLPAFDVRDVWQFYHPPLHHILCAGWMHLMEYIGLSQEQVYESVQVLPFTYGCLLLVVFGMMLQHFGLKREAFVFPFAIFAVHPSLIILSGSINNDMLSILFMGTSLLLTLRWYREPKFSTILALALTIGLGMFTKLSAWMAAPAAAFVFLLRLVRDKEIRMKYVVQYLLFGCVCVPIGMFWPLRNKLGWDVPLAYIPRITANSGQYVGDRSISERLLDFSASQFAYIYDCFSDYGQAYSEYNPLIGLLKTAVFDEFVNTDRFPHVQYFGEILFWSQVVLAVLVLVALVSVFFSKALMPEKMALLLTYGITLLCYFAFCLTYPHTCTQSFRYAVPTLYASLLFLGLGLDRKPLPLPGKAVLGTATGVFIGASALIFGVLLYLP